MELSKIMNEPQIIAVIGDINQGKSMFIYNILNQLKKEFKFNLYTSGLRLNLNEQKVYTVEEIEQIENSVIVIDDNFGLLDTSDKKKRGQIERTLRLIHHNNNILILSGTPENFKKFISAKVNKAFFKKVTIADLINGSRMKNVVTNYNGLELGSSILDMPKDKVLYWDGLHYDKVDSPYNEQFDTKKHNQAILQKGTGNGTEKSSKKVQENNIENEFKEMMVETNQVINQEEETPLFYELIEPKQEDVEVKVENDTIEN